VPYVIDHRANGRTFWLDRARARYAHMCKRIFSWAHSFDDLEFDKYIIALTYVRNEDWQADDIRGFMLKLRDRFPLMAYAWVAELQRRGAVHYHVMTIVPKGTMFYSKRDRLS